MVSTTAVRSARSSLIMAHVRSQPGGGASGAAFGFGAAFLEAAGFFVDGLRGLGLHSSAAASGSSKCFDVRGSDLAAAGFAADARERLAPAAAAGFGAARARFGAMMNARGATKALARCELAREATAPHHSSATRARAVVAIPVLRARLRAAVAIDSSCCFALLPLELRPASSV